MTIKGKPSFEIVDQSKVRIGETVLQAHILEGALPGHTSISIDASTKEEGPHGFQHFPLHHLRDVTADQLPNGFSLSIYPLQTSLRNIDFLTIKKTMDKTELVVTTSFDHFDWHHPFTLWQFVELMSAKITAATTGTTALFDSSEYGFYIKAIRSPQNSTSLYETYNQLTKDILLAYKKSLADYYRSTPISHIPEPAGNGIERESPVRWWAKNLVIPLAGSGVAVAVVGWLLSRM